MTLMRCAPLSIGASGAAAREAHTRPSAAARSVRPHSTLCAIASVAARVPPRRALATGAFPAAGEHRANVAGPLQRSRRAQLPTIRSADPDCVASTGILDRTQCKSIRIGSGRYDWKKFVGIVLDDIEIVN
ncbi:unnamed protein product, partial [Iphiclides podalirius]